MLKSTISFFSSSGVKAEDKGALQSILGAEGVLRIRHLSVHLIATKLHAKKTVDRIL